MINYRKLDLPENPLKDMSILDSVKITGTYGRYSLIRPELILSDEVLDIFKSLQVRPRFVVLFSCNDMARTEDFRMIHTDIHLHDRSKLDNSRWRKMLFGINWELFSENTFSWWDMSALKECWPVENDGVKYDYLNGIHYVKRGNIGVPPGAIKIEQTLIDRPTLVRTELPHTTAYKNSTRTRIGISVRFDESNIADWDAVTELFKSVTV